MQKDLQKALGEHSQALGKVIGDSMISMQNQLTTFVDTTVTAKLASLAPAEGGGVRVAGGIFAIEKFRVGHG